MPSNLLEPLKSLARDAGYAIAQIYRANEWTVTTKSDESPLTQADLAANEIIMTGLRSLSSDRVISEEEAFTDAPGPNDRFWLVDPLDGTKDFVNREDTFCVCIALIENGEPILSVIHSPITDELWWAEKGQGSFHETKGRLRNTRTQKTDLVAVGSRSIPSDRMKLLYETFDIARVERFGSALKFCRMAEGDFDVYPRFGPMMEWDTAAGQLIAEEAGCRVIDINTTERLRYGKPGLANRGFLCLRADLTLDQKLSTLNISKK